MKSRLSVWVHDMLIALDQLGGCWIRGWGYVWCNDEAPNPDETISSWVGRHAVSGEKWALIAERLIDAAFGQGHCRRNIGH